MLLKYTDLKILVSGKNLFALILKSLSLNLIKSSSKKNKRKHLKSFTLISGLSSNSLTKRRKYKNIFIVKKIVYLM